MTMAKTPDKTKSQKDPAKPTRAKAHRPEVQPIGPALAELLNPAINAGDAGIGSGTGLQPPPDNSKDRRSGGEAAAHRARASTQTNDTLPREPSVDRNMTRNTIERRDAGRGGTRADPRAGFNEAPQAAFANYGTTATVPTLDPELAKQLGLDVEDDDTLARPARNKMEALGVAATADALEALLREGRPEFGTTVWTPHRPPRPEKSEGGVPFEIKSEYQPRGDQPLAIKELVEGIDRDDRTQVLLGVTGSGKTYTMAKVIEATQRPALILAPNKTLAAQLYGEFKSFFPDNAVEYFVSYYDYYQPEAYVPRTDTYIEKDSSINEQIDRMRHSATRSLLERDDVIIVASVSCIYGIGSVETYTAMTFSLKKNERIDQRQIIADLVALQYKRTSADFTRGTFRVRGDVIDIFPAHYEDRAWRVNLFGDTIEGIEEFDPLTGQKSDELEFVKVYSNSHYVTPRPTLIQAIKGIKIELKQRLDQLNAQGRLLEAQRLEQRTMFDLEMMEATGSCAGIENYSRYLTGRQPGEPPPTLFEYVPDNALVFADESHVTVPQIGGMFRGDFRRKATLAEYGFRLPSCMDNRPLRFEEWDAMRPQSVAVSATPSGWELNESGGVFVEQVIRPTGLIDPPVDIRPARTQVDDLVGEVRATAAKGYRSLVTVLTKRMAEDLTEYLHEQGIRVRYMHSDIDTIERIEIIRDLRLGAFDALVGINLLARGPRHSRMRAGGDPRRRQGRFPAQRDLADPDHRPRRAQRRRQGDPLCRPDDRLDGARDRRDQSPPRKAGRLQHRARHHAGEHQEEHRRHPRQRLRARPRAGRDRRRRHGRRRHRHRPQFRGGAVRPRSAHARSGRGFELRGSRAAARRGQAAARDGAGGGRRPDHEAAHRRAEGRRLRRHAQIRRRREPAGKGEDRQARRVGASSGSKVHKPELDEMHGPESLPYRPQSGGRSSAGRPGSRGGWKRGR